MKKFISMILVLILCLSIAGCGSELSKEELLQQATSIQWYTINDEYQANPIRARSMFEGNAYKFSGRLDAFLSGNRIVIRPERSADLFSIIIKVSESQIMELSIDQEITVIGIVETLGSQHNTTAGCGVVLKNAYILS